MKSRALQVMYKEWQSTATAEHIAFVDEIYAMCERNYSNGGDTVVECYTPEEILESFKTLDDAKNLCGLKVEQALNARWGEDTDEELKLSKRFDEWTDRPDSMSPLDEGPHPLY